MIKEGNRVSIEYTLKLDDGSVVESNVGKDPLIYEHGTGQILTKLEKELEPLDVNEGKKVTLSPEDGYGQVNPDAFHEVEPDVVPDDARKEGAMLIATDQEGRQNQVRVHEVHDDRVVLDFNHHLAGERLHFDVKVVAID